jgi:hypothetical protein
MSVTPRAPWPEGAGDGANLASCRGLNAPPSASNGAYALLGHDCNSYVFLTVLHFS